jgi:long-subunit fatty acid transport protein
LVKGVVSNPNDLQPSTVIVNQTSINDSSNAFSWAFGALVRPNENVSIGFDYTKGPSFKLKERFLFNPGRSLTNPVLGTNLPLIPFDSGFADPTTLSIHVPDHFGFGASARPIPRLLVAADIVRVN